MLCPRCGHENRPGARFCRDCGAALPADAGPFQETPALSESPGAPPPSHSAVGIASKAGILGGHTILTIGALIILFAFILPWASCSGIEVTGLELATQPSEYGAEETARILLLVPLGALGLIVLGVLGLGSNILGFFKKTLPLIYHRLSALVPAAVAVLAWLCGCCPSCAFFVNIQRQRSDPNSMGLGALIQVEYGFWLTVIGLGVALLGLALAIAGGILSQFSPKIAPSRGGTEAKH